MLPRYAKEGGKQLEAEDHPIEREDAISEYALQRQLSQ